MKKIEIGEKFVDLLLIGYSANLFIKEMNLLSQFKTWYDSKDPKELLDNIGKDLVQSHKRLILEEEVKELREFLDNLKKLK